MGERAGWLMSYHAAGQTWLDSDGMHLAQSADGLNWEPLHGGERCEHGDAATGFGVSLFLAPTVGTCRFLANARAFSPAAERGKRAWAPFKAVLQNATHCTGGKLLRDPFVLWHPPSGKFHALWTTGWASPTIGHASSADLVTWSTQRELDVTRNLARPINAWAPEAVFDKASGRTMIFWSTALGEAWTRPVDIRKSAHAVYYALTSDFATFTDARPLLPVPPAGPSVIDATMAPRVPADGPFYYLVYKLEGNKTLSVARAAALEGPYEPLAHDIAPGASAEGPSVARGRGKADASATIYFDVYERGQYGAVRAASMRGPWTEASHELSMPRGVRHATVFRVPKAQWQRLRASFGTRDRGAWRPDGVK